MTRKYFIQQLLRQIYGDYLRDDSVITYNLVNTYINQGLALAIKQNYKEAIQLDGIGYVNNSFYTTFKGIAVTKDENFIYKLILPQLPIGVGRNEGVSTLQFKDEDNNLSLPIVWLSENQKGYYQSMRPIPNKVLAYPQGIFIYIITTIPLTEYTATVSMMSGGDSTDIMTTLNCPDDYIPVITDYVTKMLIQERVIDKDDSNEGEDIP